MSNDQSPPPEWASDTDEDDPIREEPARPPERVSLPQWRYAPDAWRWVRRLDSRSARRVLRVRSARVLPAGMRARILALGIPADVLEPTLRSIRSPDRWADKWIETAQRYLGDYRRQASSKNPVEAAQARRLAALSYHVAQLLEFDDDRTVRMCRAAAASLFAQAQPFMYPQARKILVPWRSAELPAYVISPGPQTRPNGLVVLLNGASTSKEETFSWAGMFLRAGLTVLALDSPGTGEATSVRGRGYEDDDILDGVFDLLKQEPMIDSAQVSVVGVSLGGNQAIRCAAYDRRILCAVAVTPPYDPARWLHRASPFLLAQLDSLVDDPELDPWEQADLFSLHDVALDVQCPVLIFGGARDLVVPPSESELLAARLGALGTLAWYPSGGHCLYAELPSWTSEAATWVTSVAAAKGIEMQASGVADPELIAAMAREQLEESTALGEDPYGEEDEGSARLIDPDDHDPDDLGASARLIERRTDDT